MVRSAPRIRPTRTGGMGRRFRESIRERQDLWKSFGPALAVAVVGFAIAWFFTAPAPPGELTIAAGRRDGAYYRYCQEYARFFAEHGDTLQVRETSGSLENYQLLLDDNGIDIAIVQGGTAPARVDEMRLESVASLYLEPLWICCRDDERLTDLRELAGRRVAVGPQGSGTRRMADELLEAVGLNAPRSLHMDERAGHDAAAALLAGEVDAAFFVTAADCGYIRELVADDRIRLLSLARQHAYAQLSPWLQPITLSRGVLDLRSDLPPQDVAMVAPAACLVASPELHHAFIPLFLRAAHRVHSRGDLFTSPGEFPNVARIEHPVNLSAAEFFSHGPGVFDRYLPFWVASLISRMKILLLPLVTLLFPLVKATPPIYRWRIRSRIYRWYEVLRRIDQDLATGQAARSLLVHRAELSRLETELQEITVPLSYMEEFYNLRLHVELVRRRLDEVRPARAA